MYIFVCITSPDREIVCSWLWIRSLMSVVQVVACTSALSTHRDSTHSENRPTTDKVYRNIIMNNEYIPPHHYNRLQYKAVDQ